MSFRDLFRYVLLVQTLFLKNKAKDHKDMNHASTLKIMFNRTYARCLVYGSNQNTKLLYIYIYMYSDFLFDVCKRSLELQFTQVAGGQGGGEG